MDVIYTELKFVMFWCTRRGWPDLMLESILSIEQSPTALMSEESERELPCWSAEKVSRKFLLALAEELRRRRPREMAERQLVENTFLALRDYTNGTDGKKL